MEPPSEELAALSRRLGDDRFDLAILGEGNVSMRADDDAMFVKVSGRSMANATADDFVELRFQPILDLLDDPGAGDREVAAAFGAARSSSLTPSVEAILHVVAQTLGGARVVAHTHPVAVNALLCSDRADALVAGSVFPDQVVVLGPSQLLIPYADPGLTLARLARQMLADHVERHGAPPRVIYLRNHGMFALGDSVLEVLNVTEMACKVATILLGALSVGKVTYLTDDEVQRLHTRDDEVQRRVELLRGAPEDRTQELAF